MSFLMHLFLSINVIVIIFQTGNIFCVAQFLQVGNKLVGNNFIGNSLQGNFNSVSLSSDGKTAAVGGFMDDGGKGAVWVYTRNAVNGVYEQQGNKIVANDATGNNVQQGKSVALSFDGNTLVFGGINDIEGIGAVWVYTRPNNNYFNNFVEMQKLVGAGFSGSVVQQGYAVAISSDGTKIVLSGPNDNNGIGAVWIFTFSANSFQEHLKLTPSDCSGNVVNFGDGVSMTEDGRKIAVCGPRDNGNIGAVWIFTKDAAAGVWFQQGSKIIPPSTTSAYYLISLLSYDGLTLSLGGSTMEMDNKSNTAIQWILTRSSTTSSNWKIQQNLAFSSSASISLSTTSISFSLDGNLMVLGASGDNYDQGSTFIFTRGNSTDLFSPSLQTKLIGNNVIGFNSYQGSSVAISADGSTIITGGPLDNSGVGAAWIFAIPDCQPPIDGSFIFDPSSCFLFNNIICTPICNTAAGFRQLGSSVVSQTCVGGTLISLNGNGICTNQEYVQQGQKLVGSGYVGSPQQGFMNSISTNAEGNILGVGGPYDKSNFGAVWIFTKSNQSIWQQQGNKLLPSDNNGTALFGSSTSFNAAGDILVVGGFNDTNGVGATWIFTNQNGIWSQQGKKLVGSGFVCSTGCVWQGFSVVISQDSSTIAVSGINDNNNVGAIWIFTNSKNGTFSQQGPKLVGSGYVGATLIGNTMGISFDGNILTADSFNSDSSIGAVWTFTRTAGIWSQMGDKIVSGSNGISPYYDVTALSADGSTMTIGAQNDGSDIGAAWIFTLQNGIWVQQSDIMNGAGLIGNARFGYRVSLSGDGNSFLSGACYDNSNIGTAFIFSRIAGHWYQYQPKIIGSGALGQAMQGASVSLSSNGRAAFVGGNQDNSDVGAVWVFALPDCVLPGNMNYNLSNSCVYWNGTTCFISCAQNYTLTGGDLSMTCQYGVLSTPTGICQLMSPAISSISPSTSTIILGTIETLTLFGEYLQDSDHLILSNAANGIVIYGMVTSSSETSASFLVNLSNFEFTSIASNTSENYLYFDVAVYSSYKGYSLPFSKIIISRTPALLSINTSYSSIPNLVLGPSGLIYSFIDGPPADICSYQIFINNTLAIGNRMPSFNCSSGTSFPIIVKVVIPSANNFKITLPYEYNITYVIPPTVTSICPTLIEAQVNETIVVQGSNFYFSPALRCLLNGTVASVPFVAGEDSLICTMNWPYNTTSESVIVSFGIANDGETPSNDGKNVTISGTCSTSKPGSVPGPSGCECPIGTYDLSSSCSPCAEGYYNNQSNQVFCFPCPGNMNTNGSLGSSSILNCKCKIDYFPNINYDPLSPSCLECKIGMSCQGDNIVIIKRGYWRSSNESANVLLCPGGTTACIGTQENSTSLCGKGYYGPLCNVCVDGYSKVGNYCINCPKEELNFFLVVLLLIFGFGIVLIFIRTSRLLVSDDDAKNQEIGIIVKLAINYLQILSYIGTLSANWSELSSYFLSVVGQASLNSNIISFECALQWSFYQQLMLIYVSPAIFSCILMGIYFGKHIYYCCFKTQAISLKATMDDLQFAIMLVLYLIHPSILVNVVASLPCVYVPGTGKSYLKADMSISCDSTNYKLFAATSYVYLIFYIFGMIIFVVYRLYHNAKSGKLFREGHSSLRKYSFFVQGYKQNVYFWEAFVMGRKLLIVVLSALLIPNLQLYFACVIIFISLLFNSHLRPFTSDFVNRLELFSLAALEFAIFCGMCYLSLTYENTIWTTVLLILVSGGWALFLIGCCLTKVRDHRHFRKMTEFVSNILSSKRDHDVDAIVGLEELEHNSIDNDDDKKKNTKRETMLEPLLL